MPEHRASKELTKKNQSDQKENASELQTKTDAESEDGPIHNATPNGLSKLSYELVQYM